ncbi:hypothetical protein TW95_gp1544 [Pandoravirus inopinatum]|uniref:Uncharacterized protein n=1 Tax=Pandoravirus inopinatum TaxID=1605721 RepID=A0A0B5IZF7_9VIRU|nr:hypothetical protein TW95_gp1544 [Pandoravirus inopinatum]AJF98278.1 hypothetical protein [Pandoravirus inopinatum]
MRAPLLAPSRRRSPDRRRLWCRPERDVDDDDDDRCCCSLSSLGSGTTDSAGVRGPIRWRYFVPGSNAGAPKTTGDCNGNVEGDGRGERDDGDDDDEDNNDDDDTEERVGGGARRDAPGAESMSDLCVCHDADMDARRVLRRAGALCSSARLARDGTAEDSRRARSCVGFWPPRCRCWFPSPGSGRRWPRMPFRSGVRSVLFPPLVHGRAAPGVQNLGARVRPTSFLLLILVSVLLARLALWPRGVRASLLFFFLPLLFFFPFWSTWLALGGGRPPCALAVLPNSTFFSP